LKISNLLIRQTLDLTLVCSFMNSYAHAPFDAQSLSDTQEEGLGYGHPLVAMLFAVQSEQRRD
jgi:hypothetical protein